ncbi:MAG TPA: THUMP domain-containing protein [Eoetvoesiella sp.]
MTDTAKPRKTLTLKKQPAAAAGVEPAERRQRAGARARQVAQQERTREKQRTAPAPATGQAPPRESRGSHPPYSRNESKHQRDTAPARTRTSPPPKDPVQARTPRANARRSHELIPAEIFPVFTPCPQGLEEALTAEMQALGFEDARPGRAGCHFHTDWTGVQRANLYSRLATRILVQVAHGPVQHEDDILELAYNTPWERWFGAEQTLRVDTSAIRSPMQSLQFCNLRAKDGICDRLREREGSRPDIDTVRPDARVHLFLNEDSATLYLDTSGESLFKRGWRLDKGEAPIRENLAAGILALSGWDPSQALLDPFCGSGTILIEAAWIALGVPPGIERPFGFERLRDHNARHWHDLKDEARSRIATQLDSPLVGIDINPAAIDAANANAERAWLTPEAIRFEVGDARTVTPPAESGWLITNPPYGERMSNEEQGMWREWSQNLKQNFSGWEISVISSDLDLPQQLRLKPKRRYPLFNGALDCRLFSFEMVKESYRR